MMEHLYSKEVLAVVSEPDGISPFSSCLPPPGVSRPVFTSRDTVLQWKACPTPSHHLSDKHSLARPPLLGEERLQRTAICHSGGRWIGLAARPRVTLGRVEHRACLVVVGGQGPELFSRYFWRLRHFISLAPSKYSPSLSPTAQFVSQPLSAA